MWLLQYTPQPFGWLRSSATENFGQSTAKTAEVIVCDDELSHGAHHGEEYFQ